MGDTTDPPARAALVDLVELADLVAALVRTPSVNPAFASDATGEAAVAAVARDWLAARGVRAWLEEAAPGRPNLVAETRSEGPALVLCAHLDTVATDGMTIPPFAPRQEGGRLYGRGAYDMKGSAAALMAAVATLAREDLPGRVVAALVADEEHASLGTQDFLRRHAGEDLRGCVVTEPSEGRLVLAHKGFVWAEIETRGTAAHGSRWDLGVSAVGRMGRVIAALERCDAEELRRRRHPLVGPASLHCATVAGGSGLSTYAERCLLQVERRTLPGETAEQVLAELGQAVAAAGEEAEVRLLLARPPLVCDREAGVARAVREAAAAVTGTAPEETGVGYWMDAALFAAAGIPTVDYGPAGEGAHAAVEWVDVASLVESAAVYAEAARRFF